MGGKPRAEALSPPAFNPFERSARSLSRGQAREGSYFKSEQEDELSRYRKRRIKEGALELPETRIDGKTNHFTASNEKLAEIYAQETRVAAPVGALTRRVKSQMPPTSTAGGRHRWIESQHDAARVPSARHVKWSSLAADAQAQDLALLPEETEALRKNKAAAQRALHFGTRALVYGSLAAFAGVAGGAMLAATYLDIRSQADLALFLQRTAGPSVEGVKARLEPWKMWWESAGEGNGTGVPRVGSKDLSWMEDSTIVRDLRRKFRMRRTKEESGATGGEPTLVPESSSSW